MGLFGKKECSLCNGKVGSSKLKLTDGVLCADCAAKLGGLAKSEGRIKTLTDVQKHLAYRESNRRALESFHVSRVYGEVEKIYFDDEAHRFFVTDREDWREANPDVIAYSQVTRFEDIVESNGLKSSAFDDEEDIGSGGTCTDFSILLFVDSPWFSSITCKLNGEGVLEDELTSIRREQGQNCGEYARYQAMLGEIRKTFGL